MSLKHLRNRVRDCSGNVQQCGEGGCTLERKARPHSNKALAAMGERPYNKGYGRR